LCEPDLCELDLWLDELCAEEDLLALWRASAGVAPIASATMIDRMRRMICCLVMQPVALQTSVILSATRASKCGEPSAPRANRRGAFFYLC